MQYLAGIIPITLTSTGSVDLEASEWEVSIYNPIYNTSSANFTKSQATKTLPNTYRVIVPSMTTKTWIVGEYNIDVKIKSAQGDTIGQSRSSITLNNSYYAGK